MNKNKIVSGVAAIVLGYALSNDAYAQSKSAEVNVLVTVIGPVEKETRIVDSSGITAWQKIPEIEYYVKRPSSSSLENYLNDGDYSWMDYLPGPQRNKENDAFYESLDSPGLPEVYGKLKDALAKLFPSHDE